MKQTTPQTIASAVRRLRANRQWTQQELADELVRYGLDWSRVTVAEAEAARRRVSPDELLVLAAVFGRPLVTFLRPDETHGPMRVQVSEHLVLSATEIDALVIGGVLGEVDWARQRAAVLQAEIADLQAQINEFNREQEEREAKADNLHADLEARQHELMEIEAGETGNP